MGLYNDDKTFAKLKTAFEGKTVSKVEPADVSECLARFVFTDGSVVRLFATDLGYWVEETVAKGNKFSSLKQLFLEYGHHQYDNPHFGYDEVPTVSITPAAVEVMAPDGTLFVADRSKFDTWEQALSQHAEGARLIADAAPLGDMWSMIFVPPLDRPQSCPPELALPIVSE